MQSGWDGGQTTWGVIEEGATPWGKSDWKRKGWVSTEMVDFVKQYSGGTDTGTFPGPGRTHSPPESRITRSKSAGPKNQLVKSIHMPVRVR